MERYSTAEALAELGIPVSRRLSADRRLSQLRRGMEQEKSGNKVYNYEAKLIEGKHFMYSGRYVFYTKKGLAVLRELLKDYLPE